MNHHYSWLPVWMAATCCLMLLVTTFVCGSQAAISRQAGGHSRRSLIDPTFGFDDYGDAHTVSAPGLRADKSGAEDIVKKYLKTLPSEQQQLTTVSNSINDRLKSLIKSGGGVAGVEPQSSVVVVNSKVASALPTGWTVSPTSTVATESPHHWSALENYYRRLPESYRFAQQQPKYASQLPIYVIEQRANESPRDGSDDTGYGRLALPSVNRFPALTSGEKGRSNMAFQLPIYSGPTSGVYPTKSAQPGKLQQTHESRLPLSQQLPVQVISQEPVDASEWSAPSAEQRRQPSGGALGSRIGVSLVVDDENVGGKTLVPTRYLYGWHNLSESLLAELMQKRMKHQQETFGLDSDEQRRFRELLIEEAYCGPRNYMGAAHIRPPAFPSHVGVYLGEPSSDTYLCAGVWVRENFALTLASCVASVADKSRLQVRMGEWNLRDDGQSKQANLKQTTQVEPVVQVYIFPKYRNDSLDHNLALLQLSNTTAPGSYLSRPYGPACQMHNSRNSISANACWAPVRNVTLSEYFDAEGEGETKVRKVIGMMETPVKLVAHDEAECYKQTHLEYFNFQHPNYICSGDVRRSEWRVRLNTTDQFGSGIYCNEAGRLSLVSILHPIQAASANSSTAYGYLDLSYYKPWMRSITTGRASY